MLERRHCTADAPMLLPDRQRFFWIHDDAADIGPFFNLRLYRCPRCGEVFHAPPREAPAPTTGDSNDRKQPQ